MQKLTPPSPWLKPFGESSLTSGSLGCCKDSSQFFLLFPLLFIRPVHNTHIYTHTVSRDSWFWILQNSSKYSKRDLCLPCLFLPLDYSWTVSINVTLTIMLDPRKWLQSSFIIMSISVMPCFPVLPILIWLGYLVQLSWAVYKYTFQFVAKTLSFMFPTRL